MFLSLLVAFCTGFNEVRSPPRGSHTVEETWRHSEWTHDECQDQAAKQNTKKKTSHKQNSAKGNSEYLWLTNGNSVHSQEIMHIPSCKLTSMWKIHHLYIIFLVSTSMLVYPRVAGPDHPDHPPHHTKEQLGNLWKRGAGRAARFQSGILWLAKGSSWWFCVFS